MSETSGLLTVTEFAAALRIKPSAVRRWIREQRVTVVHVGRLVRIPSDEVGRIVRAGTRRAQGVAN